MRRKSEQTREQIIDAAYALFYKGGFMRTGVDAVAEAAGITKRTLYQHFASKDELIAVVLEHQHQLVLERIKRWAESISGRPDQMVMMIFDKLIRWAGGKEYQGSGFTRAAMEFADLPGHPARKAAQRQKQEVERYLVERFIDAGCADAVQLVRQIMLLIEGCQSLALIHKNLQYIDAARDAALILVKNYQVKPSQEGLPPKEIEMVGQADANGLTDRVHKSD